MQITENETGVLGWGDAPYTRIASDLRAKVRDGVLPAGRKIPSRRVLAENYGVARATLERAINALVLDGTFENGDGRGTYVAKIGTQVAVPETATRPQSVQMDGGPCATAKREMPVATFGIISEFAPPIGKRTDALWAPALAQSMEQTFGQNHGATYFINTHGDSGVRLSLSDSISKMLEHGVSAIAFVGFEERLEGGNHVLTRVETQHIPMVCISVTSLHPMVPHVFYDNVHAGYQAAQHLIRQGYRDLVFLAPFHFEWLSERIAGAAEAVRHAGLPPDALRVFPDQRGGLPSHHVDVFDMLGRDLMREAFAKFRFTGIIAGNDGLAYGALNAANEVGKLPGTDFGIVAFDDLDESMGRNLTSMRPPIQAMGQEAAYMLIRALRGEQVPRQVRLCSQLVARNSTRPYVGRK